MSFVVALLQIAPFGNDQNRNLEKGLQRCREAKALGADSAVFPERVFELAHNGVN
jgi:predicted amidohydrolase